MSDQWTFVGGDIAQFQPTPKLRWCQPGVGYPRLQQWFEARAEHDGATHIQGRWQDVPTESH